jgi:5'-AMP-activated protein kinase, catalytic alpha subunit
MIEALKALKELNVCWKKNGLYNMKCRWCFGAPEVHDMLDVNNFLGDSTIMDNDDSNERLPAVIKFEMQVFNNFLQS